ncbi:MAG: membrane protein insertase YidC, partial [Betaproteobacteria bacterium]|nr:membrane protein insertase YidC [Betaproteobacteria bacterium]
MNDIRRTILWVIFGFSMVLLWDQWQIHNGKQATFFPNPAQKAASAPAPAASASAGVPVAPVAAGQAPVSTSAPAVASERFEVSTDVLKLTFDT